MKNSIAAALSLALVACGSASPSEAPPAGGDIVLESTLTIDAGKTVTWAAGTTVHIAEGASVIVKGTLAVKGTAAGPVRLQSTTHNGPGGWGGLEIASGGKLDATYLELHDASTALQVDSGASYSVDHVLVDTSKLVAALNAGGAINHGSWHGIGDKQSGDTVTITHASPTISNTLVDNGYDGIDHIQVNGDDSSPVFDHLDVSGCHCAFHFNAGANIAIRNSNVHDNVYGLMVIGSMATIIENSNFEHDKTNVGVCAGGDMKASGVYFDHDAFDATCENQINSMPASGPLSNVGPQ